MGSLEITKRDAKADIVERIVSGSEVPDVCQRLVLYADRNAFRCYTDSVAACIGEDKSVVKSAVSYLAAAGLFVEDKRYDEGSFSLAESTKDLITAYFERKFDGSPSYIVDLVIDPVTAARVLDGVREIPGSKFDYRKNVSMKMRDLKGLQEETRQRIAALKNFEVEWLRERLGFQYPTTDSQLTHVTEKDPYWNDHVGRPADDQDVIFSLGTDLSDKSGIDIVTFKISSVDGALPPYHRFEMKDESSGFRSLPTGETYSVRVGNPLRWINHWYKPGNERDKIDARSQELTRLFEQFLQ